MNDLATQLAALVALADTYTRPGSAPPVIVPPASSAPDILVGYFGCNGAQIDETADHVSFMHDAFMGDQAMTIAGIKRANLPTIITVEGELFSGNHYLGPTVSQALLRAKFDAMADAGALANPFALFTVDEPELKGIPAGDIRAAHQYLRWVIDQYATLKGKPLWVNYGQRRQYPAIDDTDIASIDDYGPGDGIFYNGEYDGFVSQLRANQRTILIPAGCDSNDGTLWRANPQPFIDKAKADRQVIAVCAFIWISPWGPTTGKTGIRDNGMADVYRAAFTELKTYRRTA